MVIRSLPELLKQGLDVQYALIGIGEDRDYLLDLAREQGVAERVHMLGHVAPDDLPRWYNACDVFAMPNREINGDTEGFGMVFLEAAACAKPAIAGMAGGTGSAVVEDGTGYRIDADRMENVSGVLLRILGNEAVAERLGRTGYQRASSQFSWKTVAHETERQILARR